MFGSGDANLVEPIVVVREYPGQWIKRLKPVDLAELARLRWIEKWPVKRLAIHFERHRGTISEMLASLKTDAKRRSKCT